MPRYLLSVYGPAERGEFSDYSSKEAMLTGRVEVRPFQTEDSLRDLLDP